ncbi:hypothetical protein GWI33_004082 [Rhynchophorus ferrugineus]|uniref:Cell cycle checkpoint protein RAD17 n=1 Tax=Rhynchophorus ferrugineus TaxID=354439 RepID=A0A834MH06_RHYFE|nr:hypothetical protein GWI33_004082 [Rhynchophorus ferrugineus]
MKKFTRWKSFDFGPETSVDEKKSSPKRKRTRTMIIPQSTADLAVHSKKIQEIEGWIKFALNSKEKKHTQFLLITGPTGCGKSTTILTICKSINVKVIEWINPVDIDYELLKGPGQIAKFLEFFIESKYNSLFDETNVQKILLVKDFPNVFVKKNDEFFNILEESYYRATYPVIFVCSDCSSNDLNLQRLLFPDEIQAKYSISNICFNYCAPTLLKKALKRAQDIIAQSELFKGPSSDTIEAIIATSMGDLRSAMNQIYIASLKDAKSLHIDISTSEKQGLKKKRVEKKLTIKSMIKDESLGLFHGLGRVLNPKMRNHGNTYRINCDIQKLVAEFSIQPNKFHSFLFENYLKYFGDLDDTQEASDTLSFATLILTNWDNIQSCTISLWIQILGLMISNRHKESKWTQITGPKKIDKVCCDGDRDNIHPTDRFYYNILTKTRKYHTFNFVT